MSFKAKFYVKIFAICFTVSIMDFKIYSLGLSIQLRHENLNIEVKTSTLNSKT